MELNRRTFIQGGLTGGIVGLSGCFASQAEQPTRQIGLSKPVQGDGQRVINSLDESTPGWNVDTQVMRSIEAANKISQEEIQVAVIDMNTLYKAQTNQLSGGDRQLKYLPWLGLSVTEVQSMLVTAPNSGVSSFDDLRGKTVYAGERDCLQATTLDIFQHPNVKEITNEIRVVDNVEDEFLALKNGEVDAMVAHSGDDPGDHQTIKNHLQENAIQPITPTNRLIDAVKNSEPVTSSWISFGQNDANSSESPDLFSWTLPFWLTFNPNMSKEAVFETTKAVATNIDSDRTGLKISNFKKSEIPPGYPFHPGAAEFFKEEKKSWNENLVVGNTPGAYFRVCGCS